MRTICLSYFFTVTLIFFTFFPHLIVITVVPFRFALILPFEVTVATFLLEDRNQFSHYFHLYYHILPLAAVPGIVRL